MRMGKVIILCYHRVSDIFDDFNLMNVSISNFEKQMEYLRNHFEIISLKNITEYVNNEDGIAVAVTFDDGYKDIYTHALPVLEKYHIPATIFITTGNIDTDYENWPDVLMRATLQPEVYHDCFEINDDLIHMKWKTQSLENRALLYRGMSQLLGHVEKAKRIELLNQVCLWAGIEKTSRISRIILSTKELIQLSGNPLIEIGSHTVTHPVLGCLNNEEQKEEIITSKKKLETITKKEIVYFAYPYGGEEHYNQRTVDLIKMGGYGWAYTTKGKVVDNHTDRFRIPRFVVLNYDIDEFEGFINHIICDQRSSNCNYSETTSSIHFIGRLDEDTILEYGQRIVIWGCGFWGKELLQELFEKKIGITVEAFGDNDLEKIGKKHCGIPIKSIDDVIRLMNSDKKIAVMIKGSHDWEIAKELINRGIKNIHIINRG